VAVASLLVAIGSAQVATAAVAPGAGSSPPPDGAVWVWPVEGARAVAEPFVAPAHEFAAGHRGIDLELLHSGVVRAPAGGIVAFSGQVAGRGIVTIDHGGGLVTTLEPVESELAEGTAVSRGEMVGILALGGHTAPGRLHFGVRLDGRYINPILLLGGVPRAVLVPCCGPL
jgi:murein DD-endopeptidase MepM/ murein hydrolase activator NlpD